MRDATTRAVVTATGIGRLADTLSMAGNSVAEASNLNFLNDTPMSYIKKPDMDSIKSELVEVLNNKKDGETTRWTNKGTGNSVKIDATMIPESTSQERGKDVSSCFRHPDCERAVDGSSPQVLRYQPDELDAAKAVNFTFVRAGAERTGIDSGRGCRS